MAEPDALITGLPARPARRLLLVSTIALVACGVLFGLWHGDWFLLAMYGSFGLFQLVTSFRPPTQVSTDGVRRPWRRPGFLRWTDVSSVLAPQTGVVGVRLQLVSGQQVMLADIRADRSADVPAIGGKDLVQAPHAAKPPAPPRPRTDADVLAEVSRQADALAWQREELAEVSRRLRPS